MVIVLILLPERLCDNKFYLICLKFNSLSAEIRALKIPWLYVGYVFIVLVSWTFYMYQRDMAALFAGQWQVMTTMVFGAFIAGSSPEGSASIAYPVFTLLLKITPDDARNFAFAIQSIGMTAASIFILNRKTKLEWNYIKYITVFGLPGLLCGTYLLLPHVIPSTAKLIFVSLWFGFGLVLWHQNRSSDVLRLDYLPALKTGDKLLLAAFGFAGGLISALFGTGINILSYCFMVSYYRISEKVATPSSVLIMTVETIFGFMLHALLLNDFSDRSRDMWLACIPLVVFFAPLGAFIIQYLPRRRVAQFLSAILMVQYVGAMVVLKPEIPWILFSAVLIVSSIVLFVWLGKMAQRQKMVE